MRVVVRSSSVPLAVAAILLDWPLCRPATTLGRGRVGRLRVGMPAEEMLRCFGMSAKGDLSTSVVNLYAGAEFRVEPDVAALVEHGLVRQMRVYARRYRTAQGLGVGSALADLTRCFSIEFVREGLARAPELGMEFEASGFRVSSILVS